MTAGFRNIIKGSFRPGIRWKLLAFLLPLAFLLVLTVTWAGAKITENAVRKELLRRGATISRVTALSAGYLMLGNDQLGLDKLAAETKESGDDIAYIVIRDASGIVIAHDQIQERGKLFQPSARIASLGFFSETHADEVIRNNRTLMEFTTPISFAGKLVGTVTAALNPVSLEGAHRSVHHSILVIASIIFGIVFLGILWASSLLTVRIKRLHEGLLAIDSGKPFHPIPAGSSDELGVLTRKFNHMAENLFSQQIDLKAKASQVEEAYIGMVRVVAASLDARDSYTLGHSTRVAKLSCAMGKLLGLSEESLEDLERAAIFHDLGKIQTPDSVLLKNARLSNTEAQRMRNHPLDATEILQKAPFLRRYIPVVRAHHEWFNGQGYPDGKSGNEIPLHAQIISLADAFDAMTTDRPYRRAKGAEEAVEEILRHRGTQFAPDLADSFAEMILNYPPTEFTSRPKTAARSSVH